MENMIKKMELVEIEGKSVAEVTLCNRTKEVYYYYRPAMSGIMSGFDVKQNGKEIEYKGPIAKLRDVFPDSYNTINPNECLIYSETISDMYDFNPNEEVEISYGIGFYDKEGKFLADNKFTKIFKKVQKTDPNKKFEWIKRYRLE